MRLNWKDKLYVAGYLLTNNRDVTNKNIGVEWNKWNRLTFDQYDLFFHPEQHVYSVKNDDIYYVLIGHAYNPFTMEWDEVQILNKLASLYGKTEYQEYFDQLTGLFLYVVIQDEKLILNTDCAGMLPAYYAKVSDQVYCSAYSQMIADLCELTEDEYVTKLKRSKLFHLYGWFLPGDMSPYKEVKRIVANTEVRYQKGEFNCKRFYPRSEYSIIDDSMYDETVKRIGDIMHNNMLLILKKWKKPAISLTGGMDSQTTLACASDVQDQFEYYSYISLPREETDANAAYFICESKGLHHTIYHVELDRSKIDGYGEVDQLLERHYSYLGKANENDICKRISLSEQLDCDIEVKSWVSEVARASRYKMYGKNSMPKLTPRRLTTMYKVFAFNRKDAVNTDKQFKDYLEKTQLKQMIDKYNYPWSEFFVWEIVFGCWGSLSLTGEHKLTNDITIPYNNRALIDIMLRTPLEKRISDELNRDIIKCMDKDLFELNVHVVNGNETKKRELAEKLYFEIHSRLPY